MSQQARACRQHDVLLVLAPGGVCLAAQVALSSGGLLLHRFTLTERAQRFAFCCTFPSLATGRRYRPPCSTEPGLSSLRFSQSDRMPSQATTSITQLSCDWNRDSVLVDSESTARPLRCWLFPKHQLKAFALSRPSLVGVPCVFEKKTESL